jgi:hypothetical protein
MSVPSDDGRNQHKRDRNVQQEGASIALAAKRPRDLLRQFVVEVRSNPDAAFPAAGLARTGRRTVRNQLCDRLAGATDYDFFTILDAFEQP